VLGSIEATSAVLNFEGSKLAVGLSCGEVLVYLTLKD
jgi:hypothetical protein